MKSSTPADGSAHELAGFTSGSSFLHRKVASSPWRNGSFFAICEEACGNGKMIRDADQRRQELGGPAKGSPSGTGQSAKVAQLLGRHDFSTRGVYPRPTAGAEGDSD